MAWMRDFCASVSAGPPPPSPEDRCHWSREGPGSASGGCASAFSLSFLLLSFLSFLFFLFLCLCFPRFLRPLLEDEEEDEEDEELEEEEGELQRALRRALCSLRSVTPGEGEAAAKQAEPALRPWDPEAEQFLEASLLFFLRFFDPRPRE